MKSRWIISQCNLTMLSQANNPKTQDPAVGCSNGQVATHAKGQYLRLTQERFVRSSSTLSQCYKLEGLGLIFLATVCLLGSHTGCVYEETIPVFPTHQHLNTRPICPIHCLFVFQAAIFMMHLSEAVNLLLNTSLCVLVTHFISFDIETGWDMWGIFHRVKEGF